MTELVQKKVYIKKEDDEKFKEKVKRLGLSQSNFLRLLINKKDIYTNLIMTLRVENSRMGNNLNQIARHLNTYNQVDESIKFELELIRKNQDEIIKKLETLIKNEKKKGGDLV